MSSKTQVYSNRIEEHDAPPPALPKVIQQPRWAQVARLIPGTEVRRPYKPTGRGWAVAGKYEIGGRYQALADGREFDCLLVVDEDALAKAEELRSLFFLSGGDSRAVEGGLRAIRQSVSDDVSRSYVEQAEKALALLLGMGEGVTNG